LSDQEEDQFMATAISSPVKSERVQAYRAARQKGLSWLLDHVNDDGSSGDPREGYHFYRAPWTFAVTGETQAAGAICGWIRRNMLQPDGSIGGPYRVCGDAYAYRDATLVIGPHDAAIRPQLQPSSGSARQLMPPS
jgi:hypothetical protein